MKKNAAKRLSVVLLMATAGLVTAKGFRRHEITLKNGTEIVVYNLHMDASAAKLWASCSKSKISMEYS